MRNQGQKPQHDDMIPTLPEQTLLGLLAPGICLSPHTFLLHFHHDQCCFLTLSLKSFFLGGSSSRSGIRRLVPLELPVTDQPEGCCFHTAFPVDLLRCYHTISPSVHQKHFGTFQSIQLHHVWHLAMQARNIARMFLNFFYDFCSLICHQISFRILTFT